MQLGQIEEHHHPHTGLHIALAELGEVAVVELHQQFLVLEEGAGDVEVLEIVTEGTAHGYGALDLVLLVGLDGDGASNEGDVQLFAHGLQQGGAQSAIDAAGDAKHQRLEAAFLHIFQNGLADLAGQQVHCLVARHKREVGLVRNGHFSQRLNKTSRKGSRIKAAKINKISFSRGNLSPQVCRHMRKDYTERCFKRPSRLGTVTGKHCRAG